MQERRSLSTTTFERMRLDAQMRLWTQEDDDDKTVNSERMAGAGRRTRTKTASRRVLGSLSVQEYSPFLFSRSFFLLLRLPRAHVDLFFASCLAPEVSIRSLRRREEKGGGGRRRRRRRRRRGRRKTEVHCGCAQRRLWQHLVMSTLEIEARE